MVHLHKIPSFMGLKALTHVLGTSNIDYSNSCRASWTSAYLQELQSDGMARSNPGSEKKYENTWVLFCFVEAALFSYTFPRIIIKRMLICDFACFKLTRVKKVNSCLPPPTCLLFCENVSVISCSKPVSWWYLNVCCLVCCQVVYWVSLCRFC